MPKILRIGDKAVKFLQSKEVCDELGITYSYLRKLEERGIFPDTNYRYTPQHFKQAGYRIWSEQLVRDLAVIVSEFRKGIKITGEQKQRIAYAYQNEKLRLTQQ